MAAEDFTSDDYVDDVKSDHSLTSLNPSAGTFDALDRRDKKFQFRNKQFLVLDSWSKAFDNNLLLSFIEGSSKLHFPYVRSKKFQSRCIRRSPVASHLSAGYLEHWSMRSNSCDKALQRRFTKGKGCNIFQIKYAIERLYEVFFKNVESC